MPSTVELELAAEMGREVYTPHRAHHAGKPSARAAATAAGAPGGYDAGGAPARDQAGTSQVPMLGGGAAGDFSARVDSGLLSDVRHRHT